MIPFVMILQDLGRMLTEKQLREHFSTDSGYLETQEINPTDVIVHQVRTTVFDSKMIEESDFQRASSNAQSSSTSDLWPLVHWSRVVLRSVT